ncbi:hypothetical protein OP10G_0289 [Fimbriimonas ginsengisoli Gsoil 348]|uniref:Uncharacterized protein n=1 Tax=Fimbriimonas ginsengisoli Gsoil 348 TaxID=661478 RepID=A0A068NJN0_FIMGI|nr:hypothetical protein OP10G_0289 [Fimbriimonas ginsengisoli Gsoil 348]
MVRWAKHEDVKAEIERGADVNEIAGNLTPLDHAIKNDDVAMVDILIRAGADVNQGHPKTGRRPLHSAASSPDLRILELLLEAGADLEGCRETSTPLCFAAAFRKREAYDRLIKAGANALATMKGKVASEWLTSAAAADEYMQQRWETDSKEKRPDEYEPLLRKMMGEYPTAEEYAAHRGNDIFVFSLDRGVFTDPEVQKWARDLGEILRSPERLKECEERFLSGAELARARRERRHFERRLALQEGRKERIALAARGIASTHFDP